jgi:hypothetical protein
VELADTRDSILGLLSGNAKVIKESNSGKAQHVVVVLIPS